MPLNHTPLYYIVDRDVYVQDDMWFQDYQDALETTGTMTVTSITYAQYVETYDRDEEFYNG